MYGFAGDRIDRVGGYLAQGNEHESPFPQAGMGQDEAGTIQDLRPVEQQVQIGRASCRERVWIPV